MIDKPPSRVLYVVVCGAGPAGNVGTLIDLATERGWAICVVATPSGFEFLDAADIAARTGKPIRSEYRKPGRDQGRSLPAASAIIVAPATYNTINKWALGISDTYALGVLAEAPGLEIPTVVLPFVNTALASRPAFISAVDTLRAQQVRVLLGPGEFEPHPPGTGGQRFTAFPWALALGEAERLVERRHERTAGR